MARQHKSHRPYEAEVLVRDDKNRDEQVYTHSAYGQISVFRTSGGKNLYGSDFNHQHYVSIEINESERHRNLSRDWHMTTKPIARLCLSEAQWATFVSAVGQGAGVPCTLEYANGQMRGDVPPPKTVQLYRDEGKKALTDAVECLDALEQRIAALTDKLPKKTSELLLGSVRSSRAKLNSTLPFIADSFAEHMENTVEAAKIEVEATVAQALHRAGLEALALQKPLQLALPEPDKPRYWVEQVEGDEDFYHLMDAHDDTVLDVGDFDAMKDKADQYNEHGAPEDDDQ
jgi:hypothetical protein